MPTEERGGSQGGVKVRGKLIARMDDSPHSLPHYIRASTASSESPVRCESPVSCVCLLLAL